VKPCRRKAYRVFTCLRKVAFIALVPSFSTAVGFFLIFRTCLYV